MKQTADHVAAVILQSKLPQTILLTGESGSGKMRVAKKIAMALLCTGQGKRPCGACNACHKVQEGIHPDLTILDPENQDIKVDAARELRRAVTVLPNDGERRVTIVRHAQNMNQMAQNALLKTLEEPPRYAFFILTAEQPDALLTTVQSRCTRYELAPGGTEPAAEQLQLELVLPMVKALADGNEAVLLLRCMAMEKLTRPAQRAFLQGVKTALRDAVFVGMALSAPLLLPEAGGETQALAAKVAPQRLLRLTAFLHTLEMRVEGNASAAAVSAALCAGSYEMCYL